MITNKYQNLSGFNPIQSSPIQVELPSSILLGATWNTWPPRSWGLQDHGGRGKGKWGRHTNSSLLDPEILLLILFAFHWPELITYSYPNCQGTGKCKQSYRYLVTTKSLCLIWGGKNCIYKLHFIPPKKIIILHKDGIGNSAKLSNIGAWGKRQIQ